MTSALMEVEESSMASDDVRITGLESQILNSQEIIVRLHCELDSALLRITTLETVCSENQNDLHEKRMRIKELDDELIEREEINERLTQELNEKDEKLQNFQELIIQLKEHIKQNKEDEEDRPNPYQELFSEFGDISITDLRSQIQFDRQLRELILVDLDDEKNSPQEILNQFHNSERLKFHNLLQKSLTTEDISDLIDSDDILFELLTHLNSLSRLKETLSRDSKQLQHIRSLLHLTNDDNDELINDLINKRECIDFLRSKIDNNHDFTDFELIKYVLHKHFNFQQQQIELKEYLQLNTDHDDDLNYSRLLIERCNEAIHVRTFSIFIDLYIFFFI
jgi:chromosome segregation ATPase